MTWEHNFSLSRYEKEENYANMFENLSENNIFIERPVADFDSATI